MNINDKNKEVFLNWQADSRYFEKKPKSYFRALVVFSVLMSLVLYFIKEPLLLVLVWILYFVVYVRSTIAPLKIKYSLDRFGISYSGFYLNYSNIALFSLVDKNNGSYLRIILKNNTEMNIVLPTGKQEIEEVVEFLKNKVPFVAEMPKTEIEKIGDYLTKLTGLN